MTANSKHRVQVRRGLRTVSPYVAVPSLQQPPVSRVSLGGGGGGHVAVSRSVATGAAQQTPKYSRHQPRARRQPEDTSQRTASPRTQPTTHHTRLQGSDSSGLWTLVIMLDVIFLFPISVYLFYPFCFNSLSSASSYISYLFSCSHLCKKPSWLHQAGVGADAGPLEYWGCFAPARQSQVQASVTKVTAAGAAYWLPLRDGSYLGSQGDFEYSVQIQTICMNIWNNINDL